MNVLNRANKSTISPNSLLLCGAAVKSSSNKSVSYISGVGDQTCNTVTYTSRSICALKGSSVDISCIYSHTHPAVSKFWFSPERSHQWQHRSHPEDLRTDSHYAGRVEVIETERGRSTLRIRDLTERDSAEYHFKFKSQSFEWKNSLPGTTLSVTGTEENTLLAGFCFCDLRYQRNMKNFGYFVSCLLCNYIVLNVSANRFKLQTYQQPSFR
uniref:Immunoglobulin domain-containing protein n=1 Tax=Pundamilia nyererei TaxID=303518 RepID=A0A3B4G9M5_9CICH